MHGSSSLAVHIGDLCVVGPSTFERDFLHLGANRHDQRLLVMTVGAEMEKFALDGARADDAQVADLYVKAGAKVHDLTDAALVKWVALARTSAWKDYAEKSDSSAKLLRLAEKVPA